MKEVDKLFWKHKSCATCIAEGSTEWCQGVACPEWKPKKCCENCGHYKNNVCERTKTHPNKPKEWTCLDWEEE